jgi:hypothetical protein
VIDAPNQDMMDFLCDAVLHAAASRGTEALANQTQGWVIMGCMLMLEAIRDDPRHACLVAALRTAAADISAAMQTDGIGPTSETLRDCSTVLNIARRALADSRPPLH